MKSLLFSYKPMALSISVFGILIDIFFFHQTSDLLILFLAGLWILSVWLYKFEGKVSISGALVFLAICPFLLILKKGPVAEKVAIWAYMFFVVGVIQMTWESIKEKADIRN